MAEPAPRPRITKRKLDEVISALDDAVNPIAERPTPPKRVQTRPPSIYASLSKLGFGRFNSQPDLTDNSAPSHSPSPSLSSLFSLTRSRLAGSQPDLTTRSNVPSSRLSKSLALSSILSRAASRSKFLKPRAKSPDFQAPPPPADPLANASPSFLESFLTRLATFTPSSYGTQPDALNPARAAACGWHCPPSAHGGSPAVSLPSTPKGSSGVSFASGPSTGADRLACAICKASWTLAPTRGMTREAANTLTERQAKMLIENHKDLCPWRKHQCSMSIYRVPLKTPLQTARDVVNAAKPIDDALRGIEIVHPLTSAQLKRALHILKHVPLTDPKPRDNDNDDANDERDEDGEGAASDQSDDMRPCDSALLASLFGWEIAPATRRPMPRRISSSFASWSRASSPAPSVSSSSRDATLQCSLCQRRVGLWTQRPLNVLREHRVYCPYATRTAALPALPASSSSTSSLENVQVEGWRARLNVLLRHSLRKRTQGQDAMDLDAQEGEEELDRVHGMIKAVKAAAVGTTEVRKYVRGLLDPLMPAA